MNKLETLKYFIFGLILGFLFGFMLMNIPYVMKKSATYIMLRRQPIIMEDK